MCKKFEQNCICPCLNLSLISGNETKNTMDFLFFGCELLTTAGVHTCLSPCILHRYSLLENNKYCQQGQHKVRLGHALIISRSTRRLNVIGQSSMTMAADRALTSGHSWWQPATSGHSHDLMRLASLPSSGYKTTAVAGHE